jgi:hypothetical protein
MSIVEVAFDLYPEIEGVLEVAATRARVPGGAF